MPQIFHFTHGSNLGSILETGVLRAHRSAAARTDIADASIKERRSTITVTCGPGGTVCDYVPFYFAPCSPMLFSIKSDNVPGVDADQRGLIYLVTSTEVVLGAHLRCVFTDDNAAAAFSTFHDDAAAMGDIVDWPLMRERYWSNTLEDNDRVRRRGAEFLVHEAVPLACFEEIGVYDEAVRDRVEAIVQRAGSALPVRIRRGWYF